MSATVSTQLMICVLICALALIYVLMCGSHGNPKPDAETCHLERACFRESHQARRRNARVHKDTFLLSQGAEMREFEATRFMSLNIASMSAGSFNMTSFGCRNVFKALAHIVRGPTNLACVTLRLYVCCRRARCCLISYIVSCVHREGLRCVRQKNVWF